MWDEQFVFSPCDCKNAEKHKCMGNLPTFSAFRFFEVEVATDNRDFRLERMEISKHGKRQKNAQKAEESKKTSFIVVPRLWATRESFKVECYIFFAPEDVENNLENPLKTIIGMTSANEIVGRPKMDVST